eukprot:1176683-Prorocentrum_minimum.AAC.5
MSYGLNSGHSITKPSALTLTSWSRLSAYAAVKVERPYNISPIPPLILDVHRIRRQLALKGVSVTIYDHTEFTRSRAIQVTKGMLKELVDSGHLLESAKQNAVKRVQVAENMVRQLQERVNKCSIGFLSRLLVQSALN